MINKRNKASRSECKEVWSGLSQCQDCGFTLATVDGKERDEKGKLLYPKENTLHSTYHGKYFRMRENYGYSNFLTYKEEKEKSKNMFDSLNTIKANDITQDEVDLKETCVSLISFFNKVMRWINQIYGHYDNKDVVSDLYEKILNTCGYCLSVGKHLTNVKKCNQFLLLINSNYKELFDLLRQFKSIVYGNSILSSEWMVDFPYIIENELSLINQIDVVLQVIPAKMAKTQKALQDFFSVEFTKSMRVWDMCKVHPRFDDYMVLLWNTPRFQKFIYNYMTKNQFKYYVNENKANRYLLDNKINEVPYFFGKVEKVEACVGCTKNCRRCKRIDLSYMDTLDEVEDDDVDNSETLDEKDYQATVEMLESVSKTVFNIKK